MPHPIQIERRTRWLGPALAAVALALLLAAPAAAQSPGNDAPAPGPDDVANAPNQAGPTDGIPPAPPSTGADVAEDYFGPMGSEVDRRLVGPVQLLRSGRLSRGRTTIRLPLYRGHTSTGRAFWYILTDTTDRDNAESLGLNHSPKLHYSEVDSAVRGGRITRRGLVVDGHGSVNFEPRRRVVAGEGANAFPPRVNDPGSVGSRDYTPLVRIRNAGYHVYNAPIIAGNLPADRLRFCNGDVNHDLVHDRVVKVCPNEKGDGGTVTIRTTPIFSFARPALYISMDSSEPVTAALDEATVAPALADVPTGADDGAFSAVERLFPIINGPEGRDNPQRQGLNSAIRDGLAPLQVIGGIPTVALDYSPLWDVNLGQWTQNAINRGYRARINDEFQYLNLVRLGHITGPNGSRFGSTGIVVNCPIVHRFL